MLLGALRGSSIDCICHLLHVLELPRICHPLFVLLRIPAHDALNFLSSLDPRAHQANLLRRYMIVVQALCCMQDVFLLHAQILVAVLNEILKVSQVGLIRANFLRRVHSIKGKAQKLRLKCALERVKIYVGDDDQLEVLVQPFEGVERVRVDGPAANAVAKLGFGLFVGLDTKFSGKIAIGFCQNSVVEIGRIGSLHKALVPDYGTKQSETVILERVRVVKLLIQGLEVVVNARLPVHKSTVAIESESLERIN